LANKLFVNKGNPAGPGTGSHAHFSIVSPNISRGGGGSGFTSSDWRCWLSIVDGVDGEDGKRRKLVSVVWEGVFKPTLRSKPFECVVMAR
jgi:hypothetical protein